jgi:hypothetical protein
MLVPDAARSGGARADIVGDTRSLRSLTRSERRPRGAGVKSLQDDAFLPTAAHHRIGV